MFALLLGSGDLASHLLKTFKNQRTPFVCVIFEGHENERVLELEPMAHVIKIGHVGKILEVLKDKNVQNVICVGHVKRPSFFNLDLDEKGKVWLKRLGMSLLKGDDGLLQAVGNLMKEEGFTLLSPKDVLDDITFHKGVITQVKPRQEDERDIEKGIHTLHQLSALDIGQAIVIEQGVILGVEAIEGTQALIKRTQSLRRDQSQSSGILVKMAKHNQSKKMDLPTIGPETIDDLYQSGFKGIAIDGDHTQVINKKLVLEKANEYGLFIQVF